MASYRPWRGRPYGAGGNSPAPGRLGPIGPIGMLGAVAGPVLGIYRNFVW
ncbi:hypothetical protein ABZY57_17850 [Streptomyces sp. NPDC006450]